MAGLLYYIALATISTVLIWKSSSLLEETSEKLAAYYGLPAVVQGAVIAAIGSSFPELSSTVISVIVHGNFELGIGAIVGSAIFNILLIPAVSVIANGKMIDANRDIVYKEAQFYMLSIAVLLLTFSMAVIYNPLPGQLRGEVTRWLALIPVAVYGLYIFIQYEDTKDGGPERVENIAEKKQWALLAASLVLIVIGVEGLVRSAVEFGNIFNTPSFLWGLTIVAAGTSLPDTVVSYKAAKDGEGVTSMANVLGSNVFDLLIAIPAGVLLAGATPVNYAVAVPMFGFLTFATISLFTTLRTDLELYRKEAYFLLLIYAAFLIWMITETFGATNLIPV
ncbi:sodium:calcium antiporter [Candidatus Nanohalovita haloferacivicina]|uniref:sodium:calcium antiporter n=1 Tax=Candidatus Nanohalovita haloferacivicina TaxID=2978046 RepID=UPI00325FA01D|nr:Ca2 /Na antiporter [Candidatus Nanohalobia archaeon BNXNv]